LLQCIAVCCSVLQCVAVRCSVLQCITVCCSVLQCVAVCCSVLSGMLWMREGMCRVSHVAHMWTMCQMSHVTHMHDHGCMSHGIWEWVMAHGIKSCHKHTRSWVYVSWHMGMSHGPWEWVMAHGIESCHTRARSWSMCHGIWEWVMALGNESWRAFEFSLSLSLSLSHTNTHTHARSQVYESWRIQMGHVKRVMSHTCELSVAWVMSHTCTITGLCVMSHGNELWHRLVCVTHGIASWHIFELTHTLNQSCHTHARSHTCTAWPMGLSVMEHMNVRACVWHDSFNRLFTESSGWRRCVGCLIFISHFQQKSPILSGSFTKNDLHLKVSYGSLLIQGVSETIFCKRAL